MATHSSASPPPMPTYLEEALDKLDDNKGPFITAIESRIYDRIRNSSRRACPAIIERRSGYSKITSLGDPIAYIRRFVRFVRSDPRKRRYKGNELDSYLSDGIVAIVQEEYSKYIINNAEELDRAIRTMISEDGVITDSLRDQIVICLKNSTKPLTSHAVEQMADALMQSLDIGDQAASQLGDQISDAIGSATGDHVVMMITHTLTGVLGAAIAHVIAKSLVSAAGEHLLALIVKKIAIKTVVPGVVTMLASSLGIVAGGTLVCMIVLPIIAGY